MNDARLRSRIYTSLAETGRVLDLGVDDSAGLRRLHDDHTIVLGDDGTVRMALPFSAVPTDHVVISGDRRWWANCAWDSLAIPVAVGVDAVIDARWDDTGEPVDLAVVDGELSHLDGFVHFTIPAARWWDDIVET